MPICSCPHCNTFLKVKESQLNVAQGFVRCTDCQGLFKAKDFVAKQQVSSIDWMADGVSDIETVRRLGTYVRGRNAFDKQQIDYLLEHPADGSQAAAVPHDRERLAA
ncbi:TPA: MJ0042-type zinc finger domain-containing protein, partial [Neisseria bacilliformis]